MARMVPPTVSDNTQSNAEVRLFGKIREELSDDWTVLHSLGLAGHARKPWAEIDFVLIGPPGVFCLEVKGGRVARREGVWEFTNRHGGTSRKREGPFEQVGSGSAALRAHLLQSVRRISQALVGWGVAMPDIRFDASGPDIELGVMYDERDVRAPFGEYMSRLESYWRDRFESMRQGELRPLAPDDRSEVLDALRGDFDARPTLRAQVGAVNEELIRLTREQYRYLDAFVDNRRVLVRGGAGTGKTLLAVEEAKRQATAGKHVLLCCFNRMLATHLQKVLADFPSVTTRTIHSYMAELVDSADVESQLPPAEPSDLFTTFYPTLALEALGTLERAGEFDVLIVDEGQDLILESYLEVMDAALAGGLAGGEWRLFYDPRQNLYEGTDPMGLRRLIDTSAAQFRLTVNCRNTQAIATHTALLSGREQDETLGHEGPAVELHWYADERELRRTLSRLLNKVLSQGVAASDIVILAPRRLANGPLSVGLSDVPPLVELRERRDAGTRSGELAFSTIAGFKGLEADVVAVVGIDSLDDEARVALYVGTSRARAALSVFLDERLKDDYEQLAKEFGERLSLAAGAPQTAS